MKSSFVIMNKKRRATHTAFFYNPSIHTHVREARSIFVLTLYAHIIKHSSFFFIFCYFLLQEFCFISWPSKIWNNKEAIRNPSVLIESWNWQVISPHQTIQTDMSDALSLLRNFVKAKKEFHEEEDKIVFGDVFYYKSVKTPYLIYG